MAAVLTACTGPGVKPEPRAALPENCRTACVTAYGEVLGTTPRQVTAYSNCSADCVVFAPNRHQDIYTGIQWQCVEFARRWLLETQGVVYGDVDVAADIWDKITFLTRVADNGRIPLATFENGASQAPRVGDLLIYGREYLGTGHVAVITDLDLSRGIVSLGEQNYANQPWAGSHARQIELVVREGRHWLLDPYLLGWKRMLQDGDAPAGG